MRFLRFALGASVACSSLAAASVEPVTIAPSNPGDPGEFFIAWYGEKLRPYQVETSPDLLTWMTPFPVQVPEDDGPMGLLVQPPSPPIPEHYFYRVREGAIRPGFDSDYLEHVGISDDVEVSKLAEMGFQAGIKFAGQFWTTCYVNNNGNITFENKFGAFVPESLLTLAEEPIIAAFWGDVQTRLAPPGFSDPVYVTYGQGVVDGSPAFGVNWINVGYYYPDTGRYDKLNSFQLVLIDRAASGSNGDFDIEFNYNKIQWEAGDATDAPDGYGGNAPPTVGLTDTADLAVEVAGSGESLEFLDTIVTYDQGSGSYADTGVPNYPTVGASGTGALKYRIHGSSIPGRLVFKIRDGKYFQDLLEPSITTTHWFGPSYQVDGSASAIPAGAQVSYLWTLESATGQAGINPGDEIKATAQVWVPIGTSATFKLAIEVEYYGGVAKAWNSVFISN